MKEKRILDALNDVKDEYIEEVKIGETSKPKRYWVRWTALAASMVLVIVLGTELKYYIFPQQAICGTETEDVGTSEGNSEELEVTIDVKKDAGFSVVTSPNEIITLNKEREIINQSPWKESMESISYPLFKNMSYVSGAGAPAYFSEEELLAMAKGVAEKLGATLIDWEYEYILEEDVEEHGDPYQISVQSDIATIVILGNGQITICFNESITLPEEYRLMNDKDISGAQAVANYLAEQYQSLIGMEKLVSDCYLTYDLQGNRMIHYQVYGQSQDGNPLAEYCFSKMSFIGDENGNLASIRYGDVRVAAMYVSEGFVVTEDEARERLEEGLFYSILSETDAKGGMFSDENIVKVELTYLTGSTCEYFQPYYCFYVEIDSDLDSDLDSQASYCTYYVPALTDMYLDEFVETNPIGN